MQERPEAGGGGGGPLDAALDELEQRDRDVREIQGGGSIGGRAMPGLIAPDIHTTRDRGGEPPEDVQSTEKGEAGSEGTGGR